MSISPIVSSTEEGQIFENFIAGEWRSSSLALFSLWQVLQDSPAEQVSDPLRHCEVRQFGVEIFKIRSVSVAQCQVEDPSQGPAEGLSRTWPGPMAFRSGN